MSLYLHNRTFIKQKAVVWKITVLVPNLAKPDAEMRIGERTLKDAMY